MPATSLLYALGMDGEEILTTFYKHILYKWSKDAARCRSNIDRMRGYKAVNDLVDADTGEVVVEAGKKIAVRQARQLAEKGLKALRMTDDESDRSLSGRRFVNTQTGEIMWKPAPRSPIRCSRRCNEAGYTETPVLDIDHVNVGAYFRDTSMSTRT